MSYSRGGSRARDNWDDSDDTDTPETAFNFQTRSEIGDGYVRLGRERAQEDARLLSFDREGDDEEDDLERTDIWEIPVLPPRPEDVEYERRPLVPPDAFPEENQQEATAPAEAAPTERLFSLDAFRGLTITGMLLVNNAAVDDAIPTAFAHAAWGEPITFADLIFPWFLFIVGVAIPFSANGRREKAKSTFGRAWHVLQRSAVLFGVGLLIESSLQHTPVFSLSVLQLIALAYLVGRSVYGIPAVGRTAVAAALLGAYGAALLNIHVPGHGHEFSEQHNLVQHLNDTVFQPWNLDGLPSVLPTSAMVILGSVAGDILRSEKWKRGKRALALVIGGLALLAIGWFWSHFLLMNKPIWTPSYICFAAGWGALGLAALYGLADIGNQRILVYPFVVFGTNALVAYAGAILVKIYILQGWYIRSPLDHARVTLQQGALDWCIKQTGDRVMGGWLYTAGYIAVWWLICLYLYRRKIYVRA